MWGMVKRSKAGDGVTADPSPTRLLPRMFLCLRVEPAWLSQRSSPPNSSIARACAAVDQD